MTHNTPAYDLDTVGFFRDLYIQHGDSAAAHSDLEECRQARYKIILDFIEALEDEASREITILDYGCGTGGLIEALEVSSTENSGWTQFKVTGVDPVQEFIDEANVKYASKGHVFLHLSQTPDTTFDYTILSGAFHKSCGDRERDFSMFYEALVSCFAKTRKAMIFNALTTEVDFINRDLHYVDMSEVIRLIKQAFGHRTAFTLRNDYAMRSDCPTPYEFTVCVYKEPVNEVWNLQANT